MASMTTILVCLGYLVLGSVVVCWRAAAIAPAALSGSDLAPMAVLLLWPAWVLGRVAHVQGRNIDNRRWNRSVR